MLGFCQSTQFFSSYLIKLVSKSTQYNESMIHDYNPGRSLRSADKLLLTVPRTLLALLAKAFSVSAPAVWNSLI